MSSSSRYASGIGRLPRSLPMKGLALPMRIMVVDDDPWLSDLLKQMIHASRPTAEVDTFDRVQDALDAWELGRYQLVLADWNLPDGTGIELLQHIRDEDLEIPLVVVTGRSDRESVLEVRKLGISAYISKPFDIPSVMTRIEALLPKDESAPEQSLGDGDLDGYLSRLSAIDLDLPLLSTVKERLQQAFNGVPVDFRELTAQWQHDPAICAYLISAASSAAYSSTAQPCHSLAEALKRLGGRTALNLAIAVALRQASTSDDPLIGLMMEEQFAASERLAERVVGLARQGSLDPAPFHAAALLHRIGELCVLYQAQRWGSQGNHVDDNKLLSAIKTYGRSFAIALKAHWALPMGLRELIGAVYALPQSHFRRELVVMRLAAALGSGESPEAIERLKALAGIS
ncbi:response regulator [Pseudomonas sp. DY-1]|nr:response regulator [Pseudomonas sp. DY-1]